MALHASCPVHHAHHEVLGQLFHPPGILGKIIQDRMDGRQEQHRFDQKNPRTQAGKGLASGQKRLCGRMLERRMAGSGARADEFVSDLKNKTTDAFKRENDQLITFKAEKTGQPSELLEPWEYSYWSEKQMKEKYDFDEEDMRPYLPIDSVLSGMFSLVTEIFRLRIEERSTSHDGEPVNLIEGDDREPVDAWHPEVKFYEVFDSQNEKHLGSFYADWHPRPDKRSGAWMNYFKMGTLVRTAPQRPASRPDVRKHDRPRRWQTRPPDSRRSQYRIPRIRASPSPSLRGGQIQEVEHGNGALGLRRTPLTNHGELALGKGKLDLFAPPRDGAPIPEDLFEKLIRARNYHAGITQMRQLCLGKMDLLLHRKLIIEGYDDLEEALEPLIKDYRPKLKTTPPPLPGNSGIFSAIPSGTPRLLFLQVVGSPRRGCFTRFQKEGIMNPETGLSFRECILSKGNSKPAEELFRDFMGRDPEPQALLKRSGLA